MPKLSKIISKLLLTSSATFTETMTLAEQDKLATKRILWSKTPAMRSTSSRRGRATPKTRAFLTTLLRGLRSSLLAIQMTWSSIEKKVGNQIRKYLFSSEERCRCRCFTRDLSEGFVAIIKIAYNFIYRLFIIY